MRSNKIVAIYTLTLFAVVVGIQFHQFATAQEIELTIQLKDMKGWPGGTKFGIWEGGWEVNFYFNVSANQVDIKSAKLSLHIYAKTTGYSKAILDNLQLNGYVLEKDWTFAYNGWGSGAERDEWVDWNVPKEYVKTGQNHLFIGLYFTDLDDLWTEDFVVYDMSKIAIQVRDVTAPITSAILRGIKFKDDLYISSVSVTLFAEDPLSGVSSTFYKVNSVDWTQYQTTFEVSGDGAHTVRYYSIDNVGNKESEKFTSFKVDISPPEVHIKNPLDGSCIANPSITVSCNGSDQIGIDHYEIFWDDTSVGNTSSTSWNIANLEEGDHVVSVIAYDQVGYYQEDRVAITIDYSSPNVNIIYPLADANIWGVVSIKVGASDYLSGINKVELRIDNTKNENMIYAGDLWVYSLDTSLFSGGAHTVQVRAIDNAGNYKTSEVIVSIRALQIDTTFSDQSPVEGEVVETRIFVTDQDRNSVDGAQVFLRLDGRTVRCLEIGGGLYETIINTTGLMNPLDIVNKKVETTISVSKDTYNSNSQTYLLTVQRDWSEILPNFLAALFSGVAAFYLPIPFFERLLGEERRFSKHFSVIFCFFIGVITGMIAYNLPQFILFYTGIPSILMVILFSTLGISLTVYTIFKRAFRKQ